MAGLPGVSTDKIGYNGAVITNGKVLYTPYYDGTEYHGRVATLNIADNTVDMIDLSTNNSSAKGYSEAIKVGENKVYYIPASIPDVSNSIVAVVDLSSGIDISYITIDHGTGAVGNGYQGAVYDGERYIYLAPHVVEGIFLSRCIIIDTEDNSIEYVDLAVGNSNAKGFSNCTIDNNGKVYFAPFGISNGHPGICAILNPSDENSVTYLDIKQDNENITSFIDIMFDGINVCFVPYEHDNTVIFNTVTNEISTKGLSITNSGVSGYIGAIVGNEIVTNVSIDVPVLENGRYVYAIPNKNTDGVHGLISVLDTDINKVFYIDVAKDNSDNVGFVNGTIFNSKLYLLPGEDSETTDIVVLDLTTHEITYIDLSLGNPSAKGYNIARVAGLKIFFAPAEYNTSKLVAYYDLLSGEIGHIDLDNSLVFNPVWSEMIYTGDKLYIIPKNHHLDDCDIKIIKLSDLSVSTLNIATNNPLALGFGGAVYTGTEIYLIPGGNEDPHGILAILDVATETFTYIDVSVSNNLPNDASYVGYSAGAFDGEKVYFVPYENGDTPDGTTDVMVTIDVVSKEVIHSYVQDRELNIRYKDLVYNGTDLYTLPKFDENPEHKSIIRLENDEDTFENIDLTRGGLISAALGYEKLILSNIFYNPEIDDIPRTGKHVYFAPLTYYQNNLTGMVGILNKDDKSTSYLSLEGMGADYRGYKDIEYDGRYIYFTPYGSYGTISICPKLDTVDGTIEFIDLAVGNANIKGFQNSTYDGKRYVYFTPIYSGVFVCLDKFTNEVTYLDIGLDAKCSSSILVGNEIYFIMDFVNTILVMDIDTKTFRSITFDGTAFGSNAPICGGRPVYDGRYIYFTPSERYRFIRLDTTNDTVDTTLMNDLPTAYRGGVFDGERYIYFSPYYDNYRYPSSMLLRLDIQTGQRAYLDLASEVNVARGYSDIVFDGRYLYLSPYTYGSNGLHGTVAIVDTVDYSVDTVNLMTGNSRAKGFFGCVIVNEEPTIDIQPPEPPEPEEPKDIEDIYFVSFPEVTYMSNGGEPETYVTKLTLDGNSLEYFKTEDAGDIGARGYQGGCFDGRFIYMAPHYAQVSNYHGLAAILDTTNDSFEYIDFTTTDSRLVGFDDAVYCPENNKVYYVPGESTNGRHGFMAVLDVETKAVTMLDLSAGNAGAKGYSGGVYDGSRYIYLSPFRNTEYHGICAVIDTTDDSVSYVDFSATNVLAKGYRGCAYDGSRYVYFSPAVNLAQHGLVVILDTTDMSIETVDLEETHQYLVGFNGLVIHGNYVYFVPYLRNGNTGSGSCAKLNMTDKTVLKLDIDSGNSGARGLKDAVVVGDSIYFGPNRGDDGIVPILNTVDDSVTYLDVSGSDYLGVYFYGIFGKYTAEVEIIEPEQVPDKLFFTKEEDSLMFSMDVATGAIKQYDTSIGNTSASGYQGSCFTGRYIYMAPDKNSSGHISGLITKFDTVTEEFSYIDLEVIDSRLVGYSDAVYVKDKNKIYFSPYYNSTANHGLLVVLDVTDDSIEIIDISAIDANARGYLRGIYFDGFVYLSPNYNGEYHGLMAKINVNTNEVTIIDFTTVHTNARGYKGVCEYEGKLYFSPYSNNTVAASEVIIYDTSDGSMESINLYSTDPELVGFHDNIAYNGFIYFAPYYGRLSWHGYMAKLNVITKEVTGIHLDSGSSAAKGFTEIQRIGDELFFAPYRNSSGVYHGMMPIYDTVSDAVGYINLEDYNNNYDRFKNMILTTKDKPKPDINNLYFVSYPEEYITRMDVMQENGATGDWITYLSTLDTEHTDTKGYLGGDYDGERYIYLAPSGDGSNFHGRAAILDTLDDSFEYIDLMLTDSRLNGFYDAVYVKGVNKVYYIPGNGTSGRHGFVGILDVATKTVTMVDVKSGNSSVGGFYGACTDGRYVYMAPFYNPSSGYNGKTTILDTTDNSLTYIDFTTINSGAKGFKGCVYDGSRYVYYVPNYSNVSHGNLIILDTNDNSLEHIDLAAGNSNLKGFNGAVIHKEYIYFVPHVVNGTYSGLCAKMHMVDKTVTAINLAEFDAGATCFQDAVVMGDKIYFSPSSATSGKVVMLDTGIDRVSLIDVSGQNNRGRGFYGIYGTYDIEAEVVETDVPLNYMYCIPFYNNGKYHGYISELAINTTAVTYTDLKSENIDYVGFKDAILVGDYLYFIPYHTESASSGTFQGKMMIMSVIDKTKTYIDLSAASSLAVGFSSAVYYDGKLYLAPHTNNTERGTMCAIYDIATAGVSIVDLSAGNSNAKGFDGVVEHNGKVYFIPHFNGTIYHGNIAILDTNSLAVNYIQMTDTSNFLTGYSGAVVLGNKIYMSPNRNNDNYHGHIAILDTTDYSVSYIDIPTVSGESLAVGYSGITTDGENYIYFAPFYNPNGYHGYLARLDVRDNSIVIKNLRAVNNDYLGFSNITYNHGKLYLAPYRASTNDYKGTMVIVDANNLDIVSDVVLDNNEPYARGYGNIVFVPTSPNVPNNDES